MEAHFEKLKKRYQDLDAKKDRRIQMLELKVTVLATENQALKERIRNGIKRTIKVITPLENTPGETPSSS